ncbi:MULTISPECIES: hypothetical protein [unclassified Anabaena]|uniref:hypothetical protein n=1 Tax=unclassified Anabaena TaxID=2619674 RepID=UPI0039C68D04
MSQARLVVPTKSSQRGHGDFPQERLALDWRSRQRAGGIIRRELGNKNTQYPMPNAQYPIHEKIDLTP